MAVERLGEHASVLVAVAGHVAVLSSTNGYVSLKAVLDQAQAQVSLEGAGRLVTARRVARYATALQVWVEEHGSSVWVFTLPGARYTLHLSAGAYDGFSGGGSLLTLLPHPQAEAAGRELMGHLAWQPRLDPAALAGRCGLTPQVVAAGLGWLAASGRVGFDVAEQGWFHRDLPVADLGAVLRRNPCLVGAHVLVQGGRVRQDPSGTWQVGGSRGGSYTVAGQAGSLVCDCAWAQSAAGRGPCKHVLAVAMSQRAVASLV